MNRSTELEPAFLEREPLFLGVMQMVAECHPLITCGVFFVLRFLFFLCNCTVRYKMFK